MANISGATVSRVLSGRTDFSISAETRAKVIAAAEQLGYQPNQSARALRVPVDGIIAFDTSESGETFAQNHEKLAPSTPFVSMGAYWSEAKSYVGVDLRAGADIAMDHLLETGRRRIAYMAPSDSDTLLSGPRVDSYRAKIAGAGLEPCIIATDAVSLLGTYSALLPYQEGGKMPDAILCMNDDIALAAEFALQKLGVRVGTDVALVGFDGIQETELAPWPITTVRQPIEEMCELAWKFLYAQMERSAETLQQQILKPSLVVRDSSKG